MGPQKPLEDQKRKHTHTHTHTEHFISSCHSLTLGNKHAIPSVLDTKCTVHPALAMGRDGVPMARKFAVWGCVQDFLSHHPCTSLRVHSWPWLHRKGLQWHQMFLSHLENCYLPNTPYCRFSCSDTTLMHRGIHTKKLTCKTNCFTLLSQWIIIAWLLLLPITWLHASENWVLFILGLLCVVAVWQ